MKLVILSGPDNSWKTSILDEVYKSLCLENALKFFEPMDRDEFFTPDNPKDHRVLLRGKYKDEREINIVITSQGDNDREKLLNCLFFIKCCECCSKKPSDINYWLLSKRPHRKEKNDYEGMLKKLFINESDQEDSKQLLEINTKPLKNCSYETKDKYVKEILEFLNLNIEEVQNEVQ